MKKAKRIGGFGVEILESVRDGRVWFSARIIDPYISGPSCASSDEAYAALVLKWESVKTAYRNSNLPIPKPPRSRGNKRMLDTLRKLASRPFPTTIV